MSIRVTNLSAGDTVHHSLALLLGEVMPPLSDASIVVCYQDQSQAWPIFNGQFKVVLPLRLGLNHLQLLFYDEVLEFQLRYKVPPYVRFVRPVYIIAADDEGDFHGPNWEDCSPRSAVRRIGLGAKLLQTFTAEKLTEHGLGRRNFTLETDLFPDRPACHIFKSRLKIAAAHSMTGADLWIYFAKELMSSTLFDRKDYSKWFAFISFTRYCPPEGVIPKTHSEVLKFTKGHTALGGGGLALFGTGNLHTWAEKLEDLIPRFTDSRKIDRTLFMDDSAYRQTHWANFSTGLGAALHELGHTFDLAHTPTGVMARGFDDLYRVFTVQPLLASRSSSRDSSFLASPVAYSPRQSPVHRSKPHSSSPRHGSPKYRPHPISSLIAVAPSGVATIPTVIQVETAFRRLCAASTQTFTVSNYDGSETKCTILKNKDGTEIVTEVKTYPGGEKVAKEVIRNVTTGRSRTTMSMSTSSDTLSDMAMSLSVSNQLAEHSDSDTASLGGGKTPTNEESDSDVFEMSPTAYHADGSKSSRSHSTTTCNSGTSSKLCNACTQQSSIATCAISNKSSIFPDGASKTVKAAHQTNAAVKTMPKGGTSQGKLNPSVSFSEYMTKHSSDTSRVNSSDSCSSQHTSGDSSGSCRSHSSGSCSSQHNAIAGVEGSVTGPDNTSNINSSSGISHSQCKFFSRDCKKSLTPSKKSLSVLDTEHSNGANKLSHIPLVEAMQDQSDFGATLLQQTSSSGSSKTYSRTLSNTSPERTRTPSTSSSEGVNTGGEGTASDTSSTSDSSETSSRHTMAATQPARLPRTPEDETVPLLPFREVQYRDGGAHWYRASAVILRYHKWLNPPHPKDPCKPPELHGLLVSCATGLRLIELRTLPDSVVFHHWEFLHKHPPLQFLLKVSEVEDLARGATDITLVAEDLYGNILKKKINLSELNETHEKEVGCRSSRCSSSSLSYHHSTGKGAV